MLIRPHSALKLVQETTLAVCEIVARVWLGGANKSTAAFKKHLAVLPREAREAAHAAVLLWTRFAASI